MGFWQNGWNRRKPNKVNEELRESREAIMGMQRLADVRKTQGQHVVRGDKLVIPELRPSRKSRGARRSRRNRKAEVGAVPDEEVESFQPIEILDEGQLQAPPKGVHDHDAEASRETLEVVQEEVEEDLKESLSEVSTRPPSRRSQRRERYVWRRKEGTSEIEEYQKDGLVSSRQPSKDRSSFDSSEKSGSTERKAPKRSRNRGRGGRRHRRPKSFTA